MPLSADASLVKMKKTLSRRLSRQDTRIRVRQDDLLASMSSPPSSGLSSEESVSPTPPSHSLTLEQFTDIVLAQEGIATDVGGRSEGGAAAAGRRPEPRHVILPGTGPECFRPRQQPTVQVRPQQGRAEAARPRQQEKLKPVVLTPRSVAVPKAVCPPVQLVANRTPPRQQQLLLLAEAPEKAGPCSPDGEEAEVKPKLYDPLMEQQQHQQGTKGMLTAEQLLVAARLANPNLSVQLKRQIEMLGLVGPGGEKNNNGKQQQGSWPPDRIPAAVSRVDCAQQQEQQQQRQDHQPAEEVLPLNLTKRPEEGGRQQGSVILEPIDARQNAPSSAASALRSLMSKASRELEITRKPRRPKPGGGGGPATRDLYNSPPVVNMTPVALKAATSPSKAPAKLELANFILKRKQKEEVVVHQQQQLKDVAVKRRKVLEAAEVRRNGGRPALGPAALQANVLGGQPAVEPARRPAGGKKEEEEEKEKEEEGLRAKIVADCRLAIVPDLNGN